MPTPIRLLAIVLGGILATSTLTGCGTDANQHAAGAAPSTSSCDLPLGAPTGDTPARAVVLLVDRSRSSLTDHRQAQLSTDARWVVQSAIAERASLTLGYFDASATTIEFDECLDGRQLVPSGKNELVRNRNVARLTDAVAEHISQRMSGGEAAGSDPVAAMDAGLDRLRTVEASNRDLILLTDFIPTQGCSAISELMPDPALIPPIVKRCQASGQLADNIGTGTTVTIIGVGRTDPPITTDAEQWLATLATSLCRATGAANCISGPNRPAAL